MRLGHTMLGGMLMVLAGCSSNQTQDYADKTPVIDIRQYLNGPMEVQGMFQDRGGEVSRRFHVTMKGSWNGNQGELNEHFDYDDGEKDTRVWKVTFTDDHHFTATAHDCVGIAVGTQYGNAVNMKYTLRIPRKDSTVDVDMDDWIYLQMDGKTALDVVDMSKLGFNVGRLTMSFHKP